MSRIIPITPPDLTTERLCSAAWEFAHAVLWAEQPLSNDERQRSIDLIKQHLNHPSVTEASFSSFCERILLAREAQLTGGSSYLPQPSVWLHPGYNEGYSMTMHEHRQLQKKRADVAGYRKEYAVLLTGYYKYSFSQRCAAIRVCRRHLLRLNAYGLLTLLYRALIYCKFSQK
jgi:hypothetical protein